MVTALAPAASALADGGGVSSPGGTTPPPSAPPTSSTGGITGNATWYGPRLWGRRTSCGVVLRKAVIGVANKTLPCGTPVTFSYSGHSVTAPVIDRGPFRAGYDWDLTKRTARILGFLRVGAGPVTADFGSSQTPTG